MKYSNLLLFVFCFYVKLWAGSVDTVSIYSNSMHKEIRAVMILPDSYQIKNKKFPVVYLLHGYDGWYSNWIIRMPELKNYADTNQLIIVCPDGEKSSWYFDSPVDTAYRYETHISKEVVGFIDRHYRTRANKKYRAITVLTMGGHGPLFIALRHSDIFGAAGSMSGGVDLKESRNRFDISNRIGDTITHATAWHEMAVINLIEKYREEFIVGRAVGLGVVPVLRFDDDDVESPKFIEGYAFAIVQTHRASCHGEGGMAEDEKQNQAQYGQRS